MTDASTPLSPSSADREMRHGAMAAMPVLLGVIPFAAVAGLAGTQNGLSPFATAAFSLLAFAGAAQVAALELIGDGATVGVVVLTGVVINLRFLIYSATLSPLFRDVGTPSRVLGAYLLVDHAVALTATRTDLCGSSRGRRHFYFGACLVFWGTWQAFSLLGSLLGRVPSGGLLAFAVPISFIALLAPHLRSRPKVLAAATAASVAVALSSLPANLGMLTGTVAGLMTGAATGWGTRSRVSPPSPQSIEGEGA